MLEVLSPPNVGCQKIALTKFDLDPLEGSKQVFVHVLVAPEAQQQRKKRPWKMLSTHVIRLLLFALVMIGLNLPDCS